MINFVLDAFQKHFPHFEMRSSQKRMIEHVYHSMKNGEKTAVHAPTGTGKSLGYLIPFLAMKLENPMYQISISTYTISLQEQLQEELSFLNSLYAILQKELQQEVFPLQGVVLKGRNHYFCESNFRSNQDQLPASFLSQIENDLQKIKEEHNSVERFSFQTQIREDQWDAMQITRCQKEECPFMNDCSYYQDYFNTQADITIVNHSLFFNHLFFGKDTWDPFDFHIFDEAHKLEKVMIDTYTFTVSVSKLESLLFSGAALAQKLKCDGDALGNWIGSFLYNHPTLQQFKKGLEKIESIMQNDFTTIASLGFRVENIKSMFQSLSKWQKECIQSFQKEVVRTEERENEWEQEEVKIWIQKWGDFQEFLNLLKQEKTVVWLNKNQYSKEIEFKVSPSSIEQIQAKTLPGILLTSGTLETNGTCMDLAKRLEFTLQSELILPTPFDFKNQTMCHFPKGISPKFTNYETLLEHAIYDALTNGELKSFVLFNSKELMKTMYQKLEPILQAYAKTKDLPIEIWLQRKDNFNDVMNSFQNDQTRSVLFGTLTYFEGINLKKEHLTQVILTRLPFSQPKHPIQQILNQHHNYSEWEAGMRMKQAFGRLIRSAEDYGTFHLFDDRVYRYPTFLQFFKDEQIEITTDTTDIITFIQRKKSS